MNIANLLARSGKVFAERPALVWGEQTVADYGALTRRVAVLAGSLGRLGLIPGDRVALFMRNLPHYVELLFAAWHAGLVAVPVNAKLHPKELDYVLRHFGAKLCFVSTDLAGDVLPVEGMRLIVADDPEYDALLAGEPAALAEAGPDDVAWLFYTSGTTGRPKGAMLTHRNLLAMTTSYFVDVDAIRPEDCILHGAPMSHGSGLYVLPHVAAGAAQVVPASGHFDPVEVLDLLRLCPGTTMFAAPTMVRRLVDSPVVAGADLGNLKTIVYGGGPMYLEDCRRALAILGHDKLAQIYGQGESPMTITALAKRHHWDIRHPGHDARLASVGVPHTVVEVRIVAEDDRPLPPGETGEVVVRGDTVMRGYWDDAAATANALRGGWLHTGDMGVFDDDGFLTLKDRTKDLIVSGGSNVYPREVEEVLLRHPGVAEVAVVGLPDPEWGEAVVAFVVAAPGQAPAPAELDALCLDAIARFKRPKEYRFVDALPKNNYGKVLKRALRGAP